MGGGYPFDRIERAWQSRWESAPWTSATRGVSGKKFCLDMFPYPSGALHMGHVRNYAMGDCVARSFRMQGFQVLYPMGWDAFGLPAENEAILSGTPPAESTASNIRQMRRQMRRLGISYDWANEISTCEPEYYRWNQWIFLKLFERGLCTRRSARVNWCPSCATVLANEQVVVGTCWRCQSTVEEKRLTQWFLRTTAYAKELLTGLEEVEFPPSVKTLQRNWIGELEGATVRLRVGSEGPVVEAFTTRPEAIFGATFVAVGRDHPLHSDPRVTSAYADRSESRTVSLPVAGTVVPVVDIDLDDEHGGPAGAFIGIPAHDEWSFRVAREHGLRVKSVIQGEGLDSQLPYTGIGRMVDSGEFSGLPSIQARDRILQRLEEEKVGWSDRRYRLRDWLISRQRYWGTPIPIIHCPTCGTVPVPYDQLPVELPIDVQFGQGNPIETSKSFAAVACPKCGGAAKRDTDTMDTFVDSSWYFLRLCRPSATAAFDPEAVDRWMPVDVYIGGMEHATLHLLYARFMTMALRDLGLLSLTEPFRTLMSQGVVTMGAPYCESCAIFLLPVKRVGSRCAQCGREFELRSTKMSKSLKNTVSPDQIVEQFGADTVRFFMLSAANPGKDLEWSAAGAADAHAFLTEIWRTIEEMAQGPIVKGESFGEAQPWLARARMNVSVIRWRKALDERLFQDCCTQLREILRSFRAYFSSGGREGATIRWALDSIVKMLNPFAPHLAHELWSDLGHDQWVESTELPEPEIGWSGPDILLKTRVAERAIDDVASIISTRENSTVSSVTLTVAADWKFTVSRQVREEKERGNLDRAAITSSIIASGSGPPDQVFSVVQSAFEAGDTATWAASPISSTDPSTNDQTAVQWVADQIARDYRCRVEIRKENSDPSPRAKRALPGRPAITIEWGRPPAVGNRSPMGRSPSSQHHGVGHEINPEI